MIGDESNRGFKWQREIHGDNPEMLAAIIRATVKDSFRLRAGSCEEKWKIGRQKLCRKLWNMSSPGFRD